MPLYLIRHPKPVIEPGVCYGQSDIAIADYDDDVVRLRQLLKGIDITHVISSPLQRCWQLAQALGLPNLYQDRRLQELNFGDWEMQRWDDIERAKIDAWSCDVAQNSPPNGESYAVLAQRVAACVAELDPHETALIITHAGPIRALLAQALDLPLEQSFRLRIDYASLTLLDFDSIQPVVGFINR